MTFEEFREAMWSGLGRAILYARDHDTRDFRDTILDACLHCYAVEPQSEGTRAAFMYELIELTPDRDFYCNEVLKALPGSGDDYDAVQRFRLASYMAMDGDDRARRAMYENFNPGPRMAVEAALSFTEVDGLEGILFAADKVGALLVAGANPASPDWLFSHAVEELGEQEVSDALRKAGEANPRVEAYRLAADAAQWSPSSFKSTDGISWAELKPRLLESRTSGWTWGERTDAENLELAARDLLAATTEAEQLRYLRIFRWRAFPLDHGLLFRLVDSADERLAEIAAEALANITHPSVRDLAFRIVEEQRVGREEAILMLSRNWQPGDHEIALRWFEEEHDRRLRHFLGHQLKTIWEEHPDAASEGRMLLTHYEKGPCSMCRQFLVTRLIELGQLPDHVREECSYDANDEVRRLAGAGSLE